MNAGYSKRQLSQKLGWKDGMRLCLINAPDGYFELLGEGAPDMALEPLSKGTQAVHLFTPIRAEMEDTLARILPLMDRDGMIWMSWPKKASKRPTDITEDVIREVALPTGLVDIKVCAVDDVWSGLKLVIRKELR